MQRILRNAQRRSADMAILSLARRKSIVISLGVSPRGKGMAKAMEFDQITLLESAGGLVGAGRFERPTPCAQGTRIVSKGLHRFSPTINDSNKTGNLLSLKMQFPWMQQMGFGHSSGTVEKQRALERTTRPDEI
jgi:hypothetical protein